MTSDTDFAPLTEELLDEILQAALAEQEPETPALCYALDADEYLTLS